ncbi:MAG: hypothetical protein KKB51_18240 [Candidatus Riflebacteria bacterium]|nr:hypothetical protein [Candidatus Riflebacteria bacterium]
MEQPALEREFTDAEITKKIIEIADRYERQLLLANIIIAAQLVRGRQGRNDTPKKPQARGNWR